MTRYNYYDKSRSRSVIENVTIALAEHKRRRLPAAVEIVVHSTCTELVAKALGDKIRVIGNNGCSGREVWVGVAQNSPDGEAGAKRIE